MLWKGVNRLASSRDTSNGPDTVDVTRVLLAFEEQNRVRIVLQMTTEGAREWGSVSLQAQALTVEPESGGAPPLVLRSVTRRWEPRQKMEAAILQLLYALDFQLGLDALGRVDGS